MAFEPKRLLAKSERRDAKAQTLRKHTAEVLRTADALITATGARQLDALGLAPAVWLERFRRTVLISALLHDLGKANDHFQEMIHGKRERGATQGLRHEAVSYLIAGLPAIREWLRPALDGACNPELVLWAVAGHHRKFPPDGAPYGARLSMRVYLEHDDFHKALELGAGFGLKLDPPPRFKPGHELERLSLTVVGGLFNRRLKRAAEDADRTMRALSRDDRRFVAAVKACLIGADVAGSIGRRGEESMADWVPRAFARTPTPGELKGVVESRLRGDTLRCFQEKIADAPGNLALVVAGCGTGKTVAAYERAARRHLGRRVFFCYPTTGTATEGYRDYLADPALGADLSHGRAEIDKALLDLHRGDVPADVQPPEIHDDEGKNRITADSAGAMEQWSTPLVSCTVDTVLGLLQNNRKGLYAWPSIAGSFCVFDEVHAYDEKLFAALLRFLRDLPGVPALLMTASLPDDRLRRLQEVMKGRGASPEPIRGPSDLEELKRYKRAPESTIDDAWRLVREARDRGEKVLWVVNTVDAALELAESPEATDLNPRIYHSRFRYIDRVKRHQNVIEAFQADGFALAITTQVAEMSLDLSADLLVTQLAPIPALIQRLGRLNRRARPKDKPRPCPFVVLEPCSQLPYEQDALDAARRWLDALGNGPISQRDLVDRWREIEPDAESLPKRETEHVHAWLDGGFKTECRAIREPGRGIDVILEQDVEAVKAGRRRPEEVRVPMNQPKTSMWKTWNQWAFCPIAPCDAVDYCPRKGARWKS